MQWLSLITEDAGVQRLKADNRKTRITCGVDAVSPYPSTHAAQLGEQRDEPVYVPPRERRRGDRRSGGDRRRRQVPVILDTRCGDDRRGLENRRRSEVDDAPFPRSRLHIDLYA